MTMISKRLKPWHEAVIIIAIIFFIVFGVPLLFGQSLTDLLKIVTLCIDKDSDGYGASYSTFCTVPYLVDCDDNDPNINPGAIDFNNIDANCDGKVTSLSEDDKELAIRVLVTELDNSFSFAEEKFGSIKTMGVYDNDPGYPVDFLKERLFQRHLEAFLRGNYRESTAIHSRIMQGLVTSTRDTQRVLDVTVAHYYNNLLTKPELSNYIRPGIRGTLLPSLSIVEQLQYTGISNIRRIMDRYDQLQTENLVTGSVVLDSNNYVSPFVEATSNWPIEVGLLCYNQETNSLDRINRRPYSRVQGMSGSIARTSFRNAVEGYVTFLTDESRQGANQCSCLEAAGNDFTCPNDNLCDTTSTETSTTTVKTNYDPLTSADETPSEELAKTTVCGLDTLPEFGDLGGFEGIAPFSRSGICTPEDAANMFPELEQPSRLTFGSVAGCASEFSRGEALSAYFPSPGCQMSEEGAGDQPTVDTCTQDSDCGGSGTCTGGGCTYTITADKVEEPVAAGELEEGEGDIAGDNEEEFLGRNCRFGEECNTIIRASREAIDVWEDPSTQECFSERCQDAGIVGCSIGNVVDAVRGIQGGIGSWADGDVFNSVGVFVFKNALPSYPARGYIVNINPLLGIHHHVVLNPVHIIWVKEDVIGSSRIGELNGVISHEMGHAILYDLGVHNNYQHTIMQDCDIFPWGQPGPGDNYIPAPDSGGGDPTGGDCSGTDQRIRDLYECTTGEMEAAAGSIDSLGPYINPGPDGGITTPLLPLGCMGDINIIDQNPPDCNFGDAPCGDEAGMPSAYGQPPVQCSGEAQPTDPEQCEQLVCNEELGEQFCSGEDVCGEGNLNCCCTPQPLCNPDVPPGCEEG